MGLFGGSGDVSGYNCEQVNALRDVINNTAQQAGQNIVERLHSEIIVPMSTVWYAPEAVEFFNGFAQTVKNSGNNITGAFDNYRLAVEEMGARWADNTGGERPSLPAIDTVDLTLNVSDIQPDNAGNVTIEESQATQIASRLGEVEEGIKSDLQNLANNLDAESAFIGHGQAEAVKQCFVTVSGELHKIFKYLTEGDTNLQGEINKAVQKYQEVSQSVTNDFNSVSGE